MNKDALLHLFPRRPILGSARGQVDEPLTIIPSIRLDHSTLQPSPAFPRLSLWQSSAPLFRAQKLLHCLGGNQSSGGPRWHV